MKEIRVTRTSKTTKASVLCINPENNQTETIILTVNGEYTDKANKDLLKSVKELMKNAKIQPLFVLDIVETEEVLLVWNLSEILPFAKVEPARGTKENDEEDRG